jgi:hypothetical protein
VAYRLHVIEEPTLVTCAAPYSQFGAGFGNLRRFRHKFPTTRHRISGWWRTGRPAFVLWERHR